LDPAVSKSYGGKNVQWCPKRDEFVTKQPAETALASHGSVAVGMLSPANVALQTEPAAGRREPPWCAKTFRRIRLNAGLFKLKLCGIKYFKTSWMKKLQHR
jgi:hypothetical protein